MPEMKKEIKYPAEITFKTIFSSRDDIVTALDAILNARGIAGCITGAMSRNGKFISYTITAEFESEAHLQDICGSISSIGGFIMLF